MEQADKNQKVTMVGVDGGLRYVPQYLVDEMQKKEWRIVINPKRTYFPEYDRTSPHYRPEEKLNESFDMLSVDPV